MTQRDFDEVIEELEETFDDIDLRELINEEADCDLMSVCEETLSSYIDYKRGHKEMLKIFEPNYESLEIPEPRRKADKIYYGVEYTIWNDGQITIDSSLEPFEVKTRRVTVKEWVRI